MLIKEPEEIGCLYWIKWDLNYLDYIVFFKGLTHQKEKIFMIVAISKEDILGEVAYLEKEQYHLNWKRAVTIKKIELEDLPLYLGMTFTFFGKSLFKEGLPCQSSQ